MDSIIDDPYLMDHFHIECEIGEGAFGKVYQCINKSTKDQVALKVLRKSGLSKAHAKQIALEARILGQIDHPHIVKLKQFYESASNFMLEMELLRGGTLESRLLSGSFSDEASASIMGQLMKAVSYLHNHDIIHRDIKPENIMFKNESIQGLKLADFGLSSLCTFDAGTDDSCGTAAFMAPEQAVKRVYNKPVDIWSCGIVMYIIITGTHPLSSPDDTTETYFHKLKNVKWKFPGEFGKLAKDLFKRLTRNDPLERYTADLALRHPWITRQETRPPMTYLERLNLFNYKLKARRIFSAMIFLASTGPKTPQFFQSSQAEMPKIQLNFAGNSREPHKRHQTMIINPRSQSPVAKKTLRLNSLRRKCPRQL